MKYMQGLTLLIILLYASSNYACGGYEEIEIIKMDIKGI